MQEEKKRRSRRIMIRNRISRISRSRSRSRRRRRGGGREGGGGRRSSSIRSLPFCPHWSWERF